MRMGPRGAATLALLVITACAPAPPVVPAPAGATATASPTPPPTVVVNPPTAPPSGSPTATALAIPQLDGLIRSLTPSWRPTGEAVVLQVPGGIDGSLVMAMGLDGSPSIPLLAFGPSEGWDIRRDGSAIAISLLTGPSSARIAVWESGTGRARWVSPAESGVLHRSPVWSPDGGAVYYSALQPPDDRGIFRVGASGGSATRVRAPEANGAEILGFTPDGRGLVWSRVQAGGSVEVLDLSSGRNTSFDPTITASARSWRAARPRALVITGGCCAGQIGKGTLTVWDDVAGTARPIFGTDLSANDGVRDADWDPAGTRLVAIVHDLAVPSSEIAGALTLMDEHGRERSSLPGTEGAVAVEWGHSGILYVKASVETMTADLFLAQPSGGAPVRIFSGGYIGKWEVVAR